MRAILFLKDTTTVARVCGVKAMKLYNLGTLYTNLKSEDKILTVFCSVKEKEKLTYS